MTGEAVPLSNSEQIIAKISELENCLKQSTPGYESLLFQIHQGLVKDEALAHLLTEEQVGVICAGLSKKKNVVISEVEKASKKTTTASGKKLKDVAIGLDL